MSLATLVCLAALSASPDRAIDFGTEIIPVLTRAGCNAGACHGAAAGRGGFHLSLWGTDAAADYEVIVHALEGRRINQSRPERSLLLAKPTGQLEHGGDIALEEDGPGAQRIEDWIRAGAPRGGQRRLTSLEVTPRRQLCDQLPDMVALRVTAQFDHEPPEDVTEWTVFTSSDAAAVEINDRAMATIKRRGQHAVIARFLDRVVPIQLSVPLTDEAVNLSSEPKANFIDAELQRVLTELRLPMSPPAGDAAYLRRVTLDLTGRLPQPEAALAYLADQSPYKRQRLVESLLKSQAFADFWTLRFARLMRLHSLPNEEVGMNTYAAWLHEQLDRDAPLDQMARELLTAIGDSQVVGPANFGRMVADARSQAELVGQFFLGVRLGCANCHNHPLDHWTQDDFHGLAAVFAKLDRGRQVRLLARGAVTNPRTGEPATPRIPGVRYLDGDGDHRVAFADWLVADENRYFAKATVNRLWRFMFGRGLVEPTDDMRQTNPPSHPELLGLLAADFVQHDYSIRHTLRLIALSHAYGLSDATLAGNASDDRFYSHTFHRPLESEVLLDAIADVTGVANEFAAQPAGTRAIALVDPLSPAPSLDLLGRCSRVGNCEESSATGLVLPAQLHLLNGELINSKLTAETGRLSQLITAGHTSEQIVDEFYLRALARHPSDDEAKSWAKRLHVHDEGQRRERLEDFVWSLLTSRQFRENH